MSNKEYKNILAVDTSSNRLVLGLSFLGDRIVKSDNEVEQSHGKFIMKRINELVESSGLTKNDLDIIAVNVGPGSFTGLRIGIAAAKGLAVALNLKMAAVNLFEIAAYRLRNNETPATVVVPLKKDEFFMLDLKDGEVDVSEIKIVSAKNLSGLSGKSIAAFHFNLADFMNVDRNNDLSDLIKYDASDIIEIAMNKINNESYEDINLLEPLYLQKSQAEINFEKKHGK